MTTTAGNLDPNGCRRCGRGDCPTLRINDAKQNLRALQECLARPIVDWRALYFAAAGDLDAVRRVIEEHDADDPIPWLLPTLADEVRERLAAACRAARAASK